MPGKHRILDLLEGGKIAPGSFALGIMTKAPIPGTVKTRLQPPLTLEEAAELNVCFLRDTAAAIASCCGAAGTASIGVGVYTPPGFEEVYMGILPDDFVLMPQRGQDFGERLFNAATDFFALGCAGCCLIDSDSPTVAASVYGEAIQHLQSGGDRVVLGPSDDGGYYLIGMKRVHRPLFQGIDWSTPYVLEQTQQRARAIGLEVKMLPECFDVDDRATLALLCDQLFGPSSARAPATEQFLRGLIAREGRDRIWPREVIASGQPAGPSSPE